MVRTNIFLEKEQKKLLKALAVKESTEEKPVSMADLIRRAIDLFLESEAKKAKGDL